MEYKIKVWRPLENIQGNYWLEDMVLLNGKFTFIYRKDKEEHINIHVICRGFPYSFMYLNETYEGDYTHLDSLDYIKSIRPWCFYTVEDSAYIKRVYKELRELSDLRELKHYCIISEDERIDILYASPPVVKLIINGKVIESSESEEENE